MEEPDPSDIDRLRSIVVQSPLLAPVLDNWQNLALPDCWLAAGAVAQTVWNHILGLPLSYGISDIDLVYFDESDLSESGEAERAARARNALSGLPVWIDVKNEARVHLWYEAKFGRSIAPYASVTDAIASFPTTATAIGIRPSPEGLQLYAPYGISDLLGLVVRPNRKQITRRSTRPRSDGGLRPGRSSRLSNGMSNSPSSASKCLWRLAEAAQEGAPHAAGVAEAGGLGDAIEGDRLANPEQGARLMKVLIAGAGIGGRLRRPAPQAKRA